MRTGNPLHGPGEVQGEVEHLGGGGPGFQEAEVQQQRRDGVPPLGLQGVVDHERQAVAVPRGVIAGGRPGGAVLRAEVGRDDSRVVLPRHQPRLAEQEVAEAGVVEPEGDHRRLGVAVVGQRHLVEVLLHERPEMEERTVLQANEAVKLLGRQRGAGHAQGAGQPPEEGLGLGGQAPEDAVPELLVKAVEARDPGQRLADRGGRQLAAPDGQAELLGPEEVARGGLGDPGQQRGIQLAGRQQHAELLFEVLADVGLVPIGVAGQDVAPAGGLAVQRIELADRPRGEQDVDVPGQFLRQGAQGQQSGDLVAGLVQPVHHDHLALALGQVLRADQLEQAVELTLVILLALRRLLVADVVLPEQVAVDVPQEVGAGQVAAPAQKKRTGRGQTSLWSIQWVSSAVLPSPGSATSTK